MKKYIPIVLSAVTASTLLVGGKELIKIQRENEELKQELKYTSLENQSHIEEVKEINKNNCKLLIYESTTGQYMKHLEEDSILPIKATLKTHYSYKAEFDLSTAKIMEIKDTTYVELDYSKIKLSSITIDQPTVETETNWITRFKGRTIAEITNQIINDSYEEIEQHIDDDFTNKTDTFKINLQNKVNQLYEGLNVIVIYK